MTTEDIRRRVKETIANIAGVKADQITNDASFETLDLDSLSRIEVLVELERVFDLNSAAGEADDGLGSQIQTVEHAVRFVEKNLATADV